MKKRLNIVILITGLGGILAQILILREFLIVFLGNELTIGIILSNWLILEALGSFLGGRLFSKKKEILNFVVFTFIFSLSFPLAIFLVRDLKLLIGVLPSEAITVEKAFLSSLLILIPVSLPHGALFSLSCKLYSRFFKEDATLGKVYFLETSGTILGGFILTYLLLPYWGSFQISLFLGLVNMILCFFLLKFKEKSFSFSFLRFLTFIFFLIFSFSLTQVEALKQFSLRKQWPHQKIIYYKNSIYGNICLTQYKTQFNLFYNGVNLFSLPYSDIVQIEELVHFPLLFHPYPRDVLIISRGLGGFIREVLKYPQIKRVDYAELDPLIFEVAEKKLFSFIKDELKNKRVFLKNLDGRLYLKTTRKKYDLIWLGVDTPLDLQSNRLFTEEFFKISSSKLRKGGILVFKLPGSLTYLSKELKDLNSCIFSTLQKVFPFVKIIPSDGYNIFLASQQSFVSSETLIKRFKEKKINTLLLSCAHIKYRLSSYWEDWITQQLQTGTKDINKDFKPLGLFYGLSYFGSSFSSQVNKILFKLKGLNLKKISIFLSLLFILVLLFFKFKPNFSFSIFYSIFSSGLAGMVFSLILIFSFQVLYGYLYYWIGVLVSLFMAGLAAGGLISSLSLTKLKKVFLFFLLLEFLIITYSLFLIFFFNYLYPYLEKSQSFSILKGLYLGICFFSGLLIGAEFPLANKLYQDKYSIVNLGYSAGFLYSADLLGGFLGGILGGVIFFPLLGLKSTLLLIIILKVMSLGFLSFSQVEH